MKNKEQTPPTQAEIEKQIEEFGEVLGFNKEKKCKMCDNCKCKKDVEPFYLEPTDEILNHYDIFDQDGIIARFVKYEYAETIVELLNEASNEKKKD